jgi:hypothetical protein
MEKLSASNIKNFDWHLFWTAAGVIIPLGGLIIGCFISLSHDMREVRERLTVIETTLILKGIMPKELAKKTEVSDEKIAANYDNTKN